MYTKENQIQHENETEVIATELSELQALIELEETFDRQDEANPPEDKTFTTDDLDRIAKALWQDQLPKPDHHDLWCQELAKRLVAVADMFDDGEDVIILAKLADQLPRMFEKMRDNVVKSADEVKSDLRAAYRRDLGIELTKKKIEELEEKIQRYRVQYWTLNEAFKATLDQARPKIIANAGFSFNGGKYTQLKDLPRPRRVNLKKKVSMEAYVNDREFAVDLMLDSGLVELPDGEE